MFDVSYLPIKVQPIKVKSTIGNLMNALIYRDKTDIASVLRKVKHSRLISSVGLKRTRAHTSKSYSKNFC